MTDKKSFATKVRYHATTDTHHAHPVPDRPSWAAAIMHRWPTWLAIALAALTVGGSTVESLADVLPMLAFFYLAAEALQRRQATWLVALATVAAFAALRLQDWVDPVIRWWR